MSLKDIDDFSMLKLKTQSLEQLLFWSIKSNLLDHAKRFAFLLYCQARQGHFVNLSRCQPLYFNFAITQTPDFIGTNFSLACEIVELLFDIFILQTDKIWVENHHCLVSMRNQTFLLENIFPLHHFCNPPDQEIYLTALERKLHFLSSKTMFKMTAFIFCRLAKRSSRILDLKSLILKEKTSSFSPAFCLKHVEHDPLWSYS